jgi:hypothetical protein
MPGPRDLPNPWHDASQPDGSSSMVYHTESFTRLHETEGACHAGSGIGTAGARPVIKAGWRSTFGIPSDACLFGSGACAPPVARPRTSGTGSRRPSLPGHSRVSGRQAGTAAPPSRRPCGSIERGQSRWSNALSRVSCRSSERPVPYSSRPATRLRYKSTGLDGRDPGAIPIV